MAEDKAIREVGTQTATNLEEHAIDAATAAAMVSAGAAVVSAGAALYSATQSGGSSDESPPDPPKIELPPGAGQE